MTDLIPPCIKVLIWKARKIKPTYMIIWRLNKLELCGLLIQTTVMLCWIHLIIKLNRRREQGRVWYLRLLCLFVCDRVLQYSPEWPQIHNPVLFLLCPQITGMWDCTSFYYLNFKALNLWFLLFQSLWHKLMLWLSLVFLLGLFTIHWILRGIVHHD